MAYSEIWSQRALAALSKLDKPIASQVKNKLLAILPNPHPFLEKMVEFKVYKLRIGDYRAFIDIDEEKKELHILTVRHRKHAYG